MDKREIKQAHKEDIQLIITLAMQVWPQTYTPIVGEEQVAYMLARFYTPDALLQQMEQGQNFIICYSDNAPVGFASWSQTVDAVYHLHKLYIIPSEKGKGTGRYMINHIMDAIKQLHGKELRLNVNRYNTAAMGFYGQMGFKQLSDEDIDIGNGYFMNDHVLGIAIG